VHRGSAQAGRECFYQDGSRRPNNEDRSATWIYARLRILLHTQKTTHLTRVRIDDATTNPPIQLVDDKDPKLKKNNLWAGDSSQIALNPQNFPWMFDGKKQQRVVRITVSSPENGRVQLESADVI